MANLAANQRELLVGHALQQVAVVADHNQRARPGIEQILHHGQHIGIQIVARLVHDQHIRLIEQDQQQLHAALLPAGQVADRGHQLRGLEAEPFHQLPRGHLLAVHDVAGLVPAQHLLDLVLAERLQLVQPLREHRETNRLADVHMAGGRGDRPVENLQQRGLASAVRADNAETVAGTDQPGHVVQHLTAGDGDLVRGGGGGERCRFPGRVLEGSPLARRGGASRGLSPGHTRGVGSLCGRVRGDSRGKGDAGIAQARVG